MNNEASFKKVFKASIKAQGGYAMSIAAPTLVGVPDLAIIMPNRCITLLEAKFFKDAKGKFNRQIPITALQRDWLSEFSARRQGSALILIGIQYEKVTYAYLLPHYATHVNQEFLVQPYAVYDKTSKVFNVDRLFP